MTNCVKNKRRFLTESAFWTWDRILKFSFNVLSFDFRSIAKELADWLISNNVVEHIFGPNLHIEVCKQLHRLCIL